jgi:thiol-disulfide isomerase/thioredoxin
VWHGHANLAFQAANPAQAASMKYLLHLGKLLASTALLGCLHSPPVVSGILESYQLDGAVTTFSLEDLSGDTTQLTQHRGKVLLVNFWASWCPPCIKEMPSLQRLQQRLGDQPFTILTINVGEQKYKVWKFVQLINLTLPVLLDPKSRTFNDWGSSILPTSFLLDRQGRVRYRAQGDLEWDSDEMVSLINTLLTEHKIPPEKRQDNLPSYLPAAAADQQLTGTVSK